MQEIAGNRAPARLATGMLGAAARTVILRGGVDFRPAMLTANHRAVAANDNQPDAWREAAFRFGDEKRSA